MATTFKFGNGNWAIKEDYVLAYNDENDNFKPLPFDFTRATTATYVDSDGLIKTAQKGYARIDYLDNTDGHLLLEPSRTNSLPYSNELTNAAWSKLGAGTGSTPIVTANYGISPDGSQNADRLQLDKGSGTTTSDYSFLYDTVSSVGTGSISIWMKSNDSNTYQVALRMVNYVVCDVTPNWQRFELNNQASTNEIQVMLRGTYGTSDSADILIYGAQLEAGSYATSYIPTEGSSVTRNADVCSGAGNSTVFNDSEGVLFVETEQFINGDFESTYIFLTNSSASNFDNSLAIQHRNSGQLRIYADGALTPDIQFIVNIDLAQNLKIAVQYKENDYKLFVNGTKYSIYSSGGSQPALSGLDAIDFDFDGIRNWLGKVKQLAVFNKALTDSELEILTT